MSQMVFFSEMKIDDDLSLNNDRVGDYQHLIYPNEIGAKDTTDTQKYASDLEIDKKND